ncbi:MAG: hypothetical protein LH628_21080 [Microcoleus sp. CAN_BIN18]|nr:hypothetical protein [Microcoleus sp. CAN_BIN18]
MSLWFVSKSRSARHFPDLRRIIHLIGGWWAATLVSKGDRHTQRPATDSRSPRAPSHIGILSIARKPQPCARIYLAPDRVCTLSEESFRADQTGIRDRRAKPLHQPSLIAAPPIWTAIANKLNIKKI